MIESESPPKSSAGRRREFQQAALIGLAAVVFLAPAVIVLTPAANRTDSWLVIAFSALALFYVYLFGNWPRLATFFLFVVPAIGVSFLLNYLTGAATSRLTALFVICILFAVYFCGPWYGVAAGALAIFSNLAFVLITHMPPLAAAEGIYLHVVILTIIILVAGWVGFRQDFLRARLAALTKMSLSLHRGDATEDVVRILAHEAASVLDAAGVIVRETTPDQTRILAKVGDADPTLSSGGRDGTNVTVTSQVAERTYEVTLIRPRHRDEAALTSLKDQVTLALSRAHGREATYQELADLVVAVRRAHLTTLEVMADLQERRDPYTAGHSRRVAALAVATADRLGADEALRRLLAGAAIMHDIGKIVLPDSILNKAGPLSQAEWDEVKLHPEVGASLVARSPALATFVPAIRSHHERWDGKGYPDGLQQDDIPPAARIIAAADAFDAMTSPRVYRDGVRAPHEAAAVLRELAGQQWEPEAALALAEIATGPRLDEILAGAQALTLEGLAEDGGFPRS